MSGSVEVYVLGPEVPMVLMMTQPGGLTMACCQPNQIQNKGDQDFHTSQK
jgi:hypothetical protein